MLSLPLRVLRKIGRTSRRKAKPLWSSSRVAIIGCGSICSTHIQSFEATRSAMVVAVSDLSAEPLAGIREQWPFLRTYISYEQMLDDVRPDIVSVCTWPQSHAELAVACARRGVRGILCEKPLALRMDDIHMMLDECRARDVKVACGHQYRFHPIFRRGAELVASGAIGNVLSATGLIRGTLANNGPHLIDTLRYLLGDRHAVQVDAQCVRTGDIEERGLPCESTAETTIVFDGPIMCTLSTGNADSTAFNLTIRGTSGELTVTPTSLHVNDRLQAIEGNVNTECRRRQFGEFVDWVRGERRSYAAMGESARTTAELVLGAYESIRTRRPVRLPLLNQGNVVAEAFPSWRPRASEADTGSGPRPRSRSTLALAGGSPEVPRWFSESPTMGFREIKNLTKVVLSKHLTSVGGQMVRQFECDFAKTYGGGSAVASTSGTASIHVALGALNLEPCDEVITTPLTDMGTVIPILACNCVPVFADVDPLTGNLTAESILRRITSKTRAVILVHLFGRPADIEPIASVLESRGIALIEDCSQAHYAEYKGKKVGTFGDFGCFSLQQSKQITCGDGGITLVNRPDYYERAALFVDKGWRRGQGKSGHLRLGMNYRMTELQGAVALAQLTRLPRLIQARRERAEALSGSLGDIPCIEIPPHDPNVRPSWWKFLFRLANAPVGIDADKFFNAVRLEGVRVRKNYLSRPVFDEPVLKAPNTYGQSGYPFTAVTYRAPTASDFPGFREFNSSWLLIGWSSRVRHFHVEQISRAIHKVVRDLQFQGVDVPVTCHSASPASVEAV